MNVRSETHGGLIIVKTKPLLLTLYLRGPELSTPPNKQYPHVKANAGKE